jgi:hypothetical protein
MVDLAVAAEKVAALEEVLRGKAIVAEMELYQVLEEEAVVLEALVRQPQADQLLVLAVSDV